VGSEFDPEDAEWSDTVLEAVRALSLDVESHFGKVVDGKSTRGRYVRLYSNGNSTHDMTDYIEVEVYGNAS